MKALPTPVLGLLLLCFCTPLLHGLSVVGKVFSRLDLVIEKVAFNETPLHEAMDYLGVQSKRIDPNGERVSIILAVPAEVAAKPVTLSREPSKLIDVIKATAAQAGCETQVEPFAVVIRLKGAKPLPPIGGKIPPVLKKELDAVILPLLAFNQASIRESINFLQQKCRQLRPDIGGMNLVMKMDHSTEGPIPGLQPKAPTIPGLEGVPENPTPQPISGGPFISMIVENIPYLEALRYTAGLAGMSVTFGETGIVIAPEKAAAK